jgi:hypothetical protein
MMIRDEERRTEAGHHENTQPKQQSARQRHPGAVVPHAKCMREVLPQRYWPRLFLVTDRDPLRVLATTSNSVFGKDSQRSHL